MPKTTPFHQRTDALNQTRIWKNWSGYLVAPQYQYSISTEYYSIRNSVSLLDTSPLFKYRFSGSDSVALLRHALARDVGKCKIGHAQYNVWCDEKGFVVQDGVIMRVDENEFLLTAAEPALRYFRQIARTKGLNASTVQDVSEAYGILALQGPHTHNVISKLTDAATPLGYFQIAQTELQNRPVTISRTGYTGDLGYEIWIRSEDAIAVWDAITEAGADYNLTPVGTTALKMARVEAGLLLMDVDFESSRFAWVDAQRETPIELGFGWMFRNLQDDKRDFIGREAIEVEISRQTNRWTTVGLAIDWHDYERVHFKAGISPPKYELYREETMSLYRRGEAEWDYAGYASSFLFSSLLKKPIAIAKLPIDLATPGTEVDLELSVIKKPVNVLARVTDMPFFNPDRKTAMFPKTRQGDA
ncbi:aminomethyltransferase family protein [Mariniblastus fucicola]|uniref:Aminomethyltransferase n=1 Tax=Mariniblastus fucicola TaxID=980251 RepID=A0A5B9P5Q9_9BACT|nr:aminomethyltransferase family protein [Mariniblastus fucicola]QEG21907.1 Aminomethyltransferase [Mariniblastus fucicola]